jgi:hypothetical protein
MMQNEKTPQKDKLSARTIKIQFTVFDLMVLLIIVDYEFEKPLYIRGTRESSIAEHGTHAKKLIMPWIKTRFDGIRFVQSYLNRYKDIRLNVKIEVPTFKKRNLPTRLKNIPITVPGSRFIK